VRVAGRVIGPGQPCFLVAEAGVNHNGELELGRSLVDAAAAAGVDAIKFQTFSADRLATADAPKAAYQSAGAGAGESQREMLRRLELTADAHRDLMRRSRERGLLFFSTPFDEESAAFLLDLGVPALKVPSGEVTNLPFLRVLGGAGVPILMSTGMATLDEVREAVATLRAGGAEALVLLHCVSAYPADPADVNLRAMDTLARVFEVPVGYSDHTRGLEIPLAAVARGAAVLEKHFTLSRELPGPDHAMSLEPDDLAALVRGVRVVESALGDGVKRPAGAERAIAAVARKSLVAACDLAAGTALTEGCLVARRPGTGLSPAMLPRIVGRRLKAAVAAGTPLALEMLE